MKPATSLISRCVVEMMCILGCLVLAQAGRITYPGHHENRCRRSCPIEHPQEFVCDAQFVIKAQIVSKAVHEEETFLFGVKEIAHYTVRVINVFKGSDLVSRHLEEDDVLTITSTNSDVSIPCGYPSLAVGDVYVLTGIEELESGMLNSEGCQWNEKWSGLTVQQKLGLNKNVYIENCDCQVITTIMQNPIYGNGAESEYQSVGNGCFLDLNTSDSLSRKRSCVKDCRYGKGCTWVRNSNYRNVCANDNQVSNVINN
ncbi:metalloproteinase inhibitor 2-like [Asterias amurensis]|uniref:metalloproteinase inhibitor 2-like n=1 Tax=Asterias amurensis TaxID=7602 RepID=UPI003AB24DB0